MIKYEYARVATLDEVNRYAKEGWYVKQVYGIHSVLYLLERSYMDPNEPPVRVKA